MCNHKKNITLLHSTTTLPINNIIDTVVTLFVLINTTILPIHDTGIIFILTTIITILLNTNNSVLLMVGPIPAHYHVSDIKCKNFQIDYDCSLNTNYNISCF